jgi:hypothetical protein
MNMYVFAVVSIAVSILLSIARKRYKLFNEV